MSLGNQHKSATFEVAQFISTALYFILFATAIDHSNPKIIQFENYIQNILTCSANNVNVSVICTSLLYVDRYTKKLQRSHMPRQESAVRAWVSALMLSDAYHNDAAYAIKSWSELTQIPVTECIFMRKRFLETIHYDLHVTVEHHNSWISQLKRMSDHASAVMYYNNMAKSLQAQAESANFHMQYQSLMRSTPAVGYFSNNNPSQMIPAVPYYHNLSPVSIRNPVNYQCNIIDSNQLRSSTPDRFIGLNTIVRSSPTPSIDQYRPTPVISPIENTLVDLTSSFVQTHQPSPLIYLDRSPNFQTISPGTYGPPAPQFRPGMNPSNNWGYRTDL
jgi:hypothetical protein